MYKGERHSIFTPHRTSAHPRTSENNSPVGRLAYANRRKKRREASGVSNKLAEKGVRYFSMGPY